MERDITRLSPEMRIAVLEAARMLDQEIDGHEDFSFVTFRSCDHECTAFYVIKEYPDGSRRFEFELLIN